MDPFARLKMLHFPTNACLAFRAFKSCNVSPSKFAKKACESRKLWWQFCNFGRDSLQALGMGPFAKGFCLPDLVACRLHTLWSRKNFSSGCGPCSTQALFCWIFLHQVFSVFNEDMRCWSTVDKCNFWGFELFNWPREVDSTQDSTAGWGKRLSFTASNIWA